MSLIIPVRENIELRLLKMEDASVLFNVVRANKEYLGKWLAWVNDDKSVADTEKYIEESLERFEKNEGIDFQIWQGEKMIGGIGVYPFNNVHKKTSLGYWLREESQNHGIMTDSLKKVLDYLFKELGLNRVEISCAVENKKSSALPKKLGFTFEGIKRESELLHSKFVNSEVYSILAREWKG